METQIYLLLARKAGDFTAASGPMWAKQVLKDMILGDSLDIPFLKFIRVQGVEHSINFPGRKKVVKRVAGVGGAPDYAQEYESEGLDQEAGDYDQSITEDRHYNTRARRRVPARRINYQRKTNRWGVKRYQLQGDNDWNYGVAGNTYHVEFLSKFRNNQYITASLPTHNEFTFTKLPDNATPQLAYGCSSQEPMSFAGFFFRRRIGAGISGVRLPFLMIGLRKCLITGWGIGDDLTEKVTLSYKDIVCSTYDQLADINVPTGMSTRIWQTDTKEGGENAKAYLLQGLVAVLTVGIGAAVGATTDGVTKG